MSSLRFRRAEGVAAGVASNLARHNRCTSFAVPRNGTILGVSAMNHHQPGMFNVVERRAVHQNISSSSIFVPYPRRGMQNRLKKATISHQSMFSKCSAFNLSISSSSSSRNIKRDSRRSFSFYNDPPSPNIGSPAYTVYAEEIAFTVKAIPPEFRVLQNGTVIMDNSKRGRLLFEWTPLAGGHDNGGGGGFGNRRYRWDASTRFALTAEEAGSLLAKLDRGDPGVEFSRSVSGDNSSTGQNADKVFVAKPIELESKGAAGAPKNDGISLLVDYVDPENRQFGQIPHPQSSGSGGSVGGSPFGDEGMRGPFEIQLMVGEYQVLRSIIQYSLPKLVGWSSMLDHKIEQSVANSIQGGGNQRGGGGNYGGSSPHNYNGGGSY